MANLNKPSTPPAKLVDWDRVRREHGKPDQRVINQHEADLARLDNSVPEEKGGRR